MRCPRTISPWSGGGRDSSRYGSTLAALDEQRYDEIFLISEVTAQARAQIAKRGSDPAYGARPLRRFIQHELETRIGRLLLSGEMPDGSEIIVDLDDLDEFSVRHEAPATAAAEVAH